MNILAIETSCDETSAAVLKGGRIASNIISSQLIHQTYGGVVPELASREHERLIVPVVHAALEQANIKKSELEFIAATAGPGLIGAVLVGLNFSKALAFALRVPLIPINHIEAHIFSTFIDDGSASIVNGLASSHDGSQKKFPSFPFISLTVSGGHTMLAFVQEDLNYQVIGKTIDDAAGEAFDKTGKMLELGYPAGPAIDKLAQTGDARFHLFPQGLTKHASGDLRFENNFDFSFSGLKTAVQSYLRDKSTAFVAAHLADICASIQEAITSVLVAKTMAAAEKFGVKTISVAGGVSANSGLRKKFEAGCRERGHALFIPKPIYSTDNAAMIATLAQLKIDRGHVEPHGYDVSAFSSFEPRLTL
ncbi:MAG: tRNA (adenosine(37)-N6)-threonylcarbamoyltransferase complex transferase subunit TsaD [Rhizobacter sp.]|nr:tRNA (adenosine(37)-N6)-threonylcarbamoyltransferase complex transferase subunit TsaD [Chlorobiales bacterium]